MVGGKQYIAMTGYGMLIAYSLVEQGHSVAAANTPAQTAASKRDELVALPDAPGKDLTVRVCTGCHGAELWSHSRRSKTTWDGTINKMITRGLTLNADEYKTVLDYLSTQLGSKP
jgi:cytochrome c5